MGLTRSTAWSITPEASRSAPHTVSECRLRSPRTGYTHGSQVQPNGQWTFSAANSAVGVAFGKSTVVFCEIASASVVALSGCDHKREDASCSSDWHHGFGTEFRNDPSLRRVRLLE